MVLDKGIKYISPSLKSELLAARVYDRFVIESQGMRAKTNFDYTRQEVLLMMQDIEEDLEFNNDPDRMK